MAELVNKFSINLCNSPKTDIVRRALNQAARELLLAESSDWPFIMKTGTMVPYAKKRITLHIGRFMRIYESLLRGTLDIEWFKEVERRDNIFSEMDCASYYKSFGTDTCCTKLIQKVSVPN